MNRMSATDCRTLTRMPARPSRLSFYGAVRLSLVIFSAIATTGVVAAQQIQPLPQRLWAGVAPLAQGSAETDVPTITAYLPAENPTRTGVLIAPGGGYAHLAIKKEGEDVARWLNERGVAGFVLTYRLGPKYHHPAELMDAQRGLRTMRARAAEFGIDAQHVGMWGFSAGGHLAATAGTLFDLTNKAGTKGDAIDALSARPDFLILAYPVMTFEDRDANKPSRENLLGAHPEAGMMKLLSPEQHVTAATPPTFLFHTTEDKSVAVMNSVLFYSALVAAHVPAEMHIYEYGPHGVGLAGGFPELRGWPELLATWMRGNGWMGQASPNAMGPASTATFMTKP